jgi:hypothetical protein
MSIATGRLLIVHPQMTRGAIYFIAAHDKHDERKVPFSFSFYVAYPRVLLVYIVGRAKRRLVGDIVLTICQSVIVS